MEKQAKLVLIDGNALLYRAFYALPPLTNSKGMPTGAAYGFTRMLIKIFREERPDYLACAFDKGRKTFRHKRWQEYKITRPKMPEELASQIPLVKKILKGFGVPILEDEEYEADDLLASLAKEGKKKGLRVEILTGDKDIFQIVSSSIYVLRPQKGITYTQLFDEKKIKEELGISPSQVVDFLALAGDTSDNIPGVPGIGPVTAKKLIQKFKDLENLLKNLDKVPPRQREILSKHQQQARLSKELATIMSSVPLKIKFEELKVREPEKEVLLSVFKELEFKGLIKELNLSLPEVFSQEPEYKEISSSEDFQKLILRLEEEPFVLEIEKDKGIKGMAFCFKDEASYYLPLEQGGIKKELIMGKLVPILKSHQIKKTGHNLKEVALALKRIGADLDGLEFDTGIATYLLNPLTSRYFLEDLALDYLGVSIQGRSHPAERARLIGKLSGTLEKELKKENLWSLFSKVEMPLVKVLVRMQERGVKVDRTVLEDFLKEIEKKRRDLEEEIFEEVGQRFNLNSSKQLGEILFGRLNLPPVKKTKTGYSTDEEVLEVLSLIRPSVRKILEYRKLSKLESTYIRPLPNLINPKTGRIHTSFNQTVTATGRLSSSRPNLQNIPIRDELGKRLRKAFIAEDGYLLLSADYSQIELRILAHLSGDPNLKDAFLKGEDIHRQTAAEIFGVLPLQVSPQMRRQAKVVNFGIVYGISPYGLSRDLGISEKDAEDYIKRYFERYPRVKEYIEKTIEEARERQYVTTLMGRKRYLPGILSSKKKEREFAERTAINTPVQGGAADLIKLAMVNLHRRFEEENLGAYIILQIHDELLFEVPEKEVDKTRKIVKEEMEKAMKLSVPLVVQTKVGKNWAEMEG